VQPAEDVAALADAIHARYRALVLVGAYGGLRNGGPLRVNGFRARVWRPATRAAGLDGLRIHDLRHTAVALWIAAGANSKEVSSRVGHASVSFTLDRYGHLFPEADEALRTRLDAFYVAGGQARGGAVVELPR